MPRKKQPAPIERNVALCYVRQSYTRDENDKNSPERQRANIEARVKAEGWMPEWYEDAEGHKSGRYEDNRPGWLALKARLGDPDVIALVANDMARLHRKGWRIGNLLEELDALNVRLIFAAPGRELDTSTFSGRLVAQITAMLDEAYAEDISKRTQDSIAYRKARGKTVGIPPFGTIRDEEGYLQPTTDGAWYLPDGRFSAGKKDQCPTKGAIWRGYYDCARYILDIYVQGDIGLEKIAYRLNAEGWPFADRHGKPRPITRDDVRRVIANWPEYGGVISGERAKERPAYEAYDVDEIAFQEDRALFPTDLLRDVARVRQERSIRPSDKGITHKARAYPLSGLVYCAHCERKATAQNNSQLRSRLTGKTDSNAIPRYVHKPGLKCGCKNRSVSRQEIEEDFGRLINLLTLREDRLDYLTELAIQADRASYSDGQAPDIEQQKQEAIALCQRRIDAAVNLYGDGMIGREEYLRRVEQNEREIAHWQARTSDVEQAALELALCVDALDALARLWNISDDEDRKGMAQNLFTEIVYNLDTRRIESFKLKPWADRFLMLRASLYQDESELFGEKENPSPIKGEGNDMPPRRFELLS